MKRAAKTVILAIVACALFAYPYRQLAADDVVVRIDAPMKPPRWAQLERQLLDDNLAACREFYHKYIDDRGYLQCVVRWGANDGADDAPENFNRWPELHALGADDQILQMYLKGWEGHLKQYTEAKTIDVPIARQGMYHKEFVVQFDWMHNGEGLQLFNRMGLSLPRDAMYIERARRYAGFYMDEDADAPNYDPRLKIIKSMMNGSRGPMLRKATALDWAGDPFDFAGFTLLHGEKDYKQCLAHYQEYTDVVGDHFLNLVATTQPLNAFLATGDEKYRKWILDYMDAWLERMQQNGGIIPSKIGLDGKIGGDDGKWWSNVYGWGFSPINPTNGRRENRNRIPRALVGFNNALWVSGDQKYVDAWRTMVHAVNSHARTVGTKTQYPTMHGDQGWYGWSDKPWSVGAIEMWYWSMKAEDLQRVKDLPWVKYLEGKNPSYPEAALERDLDSIRRKVAAFRKDKSTPDKRLSDNMLDLNPAAAAGLIQLTLGGLPPTVDGGLLNARVRYFDTERRRAGLPLDVGALVSEITDTQTVLTLVNLNTTQPRKLILQGGAYAEHQLESVTIDGQTSKIGASGLTVEIQPGCGQRLVLQMRRYTNQPTVAHPWYQVIARQRLLPVQAGAEQEHKEIFLWEKGAPGFESRKDEKEVRVNKGKDIIINNVHNPSITAYLPPKDKATGTAVVIAPGGGHNSLWIAHEGYNPAKWLSDHGIAAFVLKYRLAREKGAPYRIQTHAVQDGERAIRYVREHARQWGIDPDRVGIMGFSAGGELAAYLVANGKQSNQGKPDAEDPIDRQSAWPNFQALIYSGPLGVKGAKITKDFPPTFVAYGENDKQSAPLSPYYEALKAAGVPTELYVLPKAGHGFGLRDTNKGVTADWPQHFVDWLGRENLLKK
jgi:acetyl esterase/lipase